MSENISRAFAEAASPKLHPCIWQETVGLGYWDCHRRAMSRQEATQYVAEQLPLATGHMGLYKFMTSAEAWKPRNWTFNPFGEHVWTSD